MKRLPRFLSLYVVLMLVLSGLLVLIPPEESRGQGTPQYQDASSGLPTADLWVSGPIFFDIDDDGTGDLLVLGPRKGSGDYSLHVFKWDGNSWSNESDEEGTSAIPHASYGGFDLGDLDNDGDWDVGVGSHGAARVDAYLRSVGTNWVRSSQGLQASEDAWSVDVGDFNSDGNLDLLVAGFWERQLRAFAGDGNGNWVENANGLLKASSFSEAFFCDINNDGDLDIVSTLGRDLDTDEVIWVYKGDGNGNWENSSEGLPGKGNANSCTFGDIDNDGNIDIAFAFWDNTVRTYLGDGSGSWSDSSVGLVDLSYKSLKLVDLNGDKLDDLVAVEDSDPGQVHVFLRESNGVWTKLNTNMQGNAKGYRTDVVDFDHNGHPDICADFGTDDVAGYPGSVKVWKESSTPTELGATITSPDGGEYFKTGSIQFIRWLSAVPSSTGTRSVKLELSTSGEGGPYTLIEDNLPDTGIYQWTVPDEQSGDCYVQITASDNLGNSATDTSDNAFGIDQQSGGGGDRELHDPIIINSDAEWTPENGVRSGTGSEADPYIIERWDITGGDSNCISIRDTRAYAVIRDNYLHHANGLNKGLVIARAENLTVSENDITEVHHGINMGDSEVLIENNHLYSVHARGIMVSKENARITARNNLLENTGAWGFKLSSITGFTDRGIWNYPAIIENNTIIGASEGIALTAAQGNFTGNTIRNCYFGIIATLGTYSNAMNSTFANNVIINNEVGMDIAYKHQTYGNGKSSAIIRGNLFERNVFEGLYLRANASYYVHENTFALNTMGIENQCGGTQYIRDNTISYNLGGMFFHYMRENDGYGNHFRRVVRNNDVFNNAYFALRNKAERAPEIVKDNYYGGVPGDDGDLLEGLMGNDYRDSPNNPDTPAVQADVTVINDGEEETISGVTTLDTHYFIRKGGRLEIASNAQVDLDGHRVAAKRGAELEVISAQISNGLTLSLASDDAHIQDTTFRNMVAGVSVYMASPLIEDITVQNQNTSYLYHSSTSRPKYILEPSGIYLYRDTSRIEGGSLSTEGYFGVFAFKSEAGIQDLSITGKLWGVAVVDGAPRLEACSISSSEQVGITCSDGSWPYGNTSLTIENCDLQNNPTGIEVLHGNIDSTATPHNIRIANTTVNGGNLALNAGIKDSVIQGNEFTNNGVILDGKRVNVLGNTFSGGSGLSLSGEGLRLENNTFENNQNGTVVFDCSPIFVNNDFISNQYGVYADNRGQPKLKYNNFQDNAEYGVYNKDSSTLVNATGNWWNAANGPGGEGSGDGDAVSKFVLYDPWQEEESDHLGHYENLVPETPTLVIPEEALVGFDAQGRANDLEGDIIRRVEMRFENASHDSGWFPSNAIWRDVFVWSGYAHVFDALELDGDYTVSARAFDGNDHSKIVSDEITVNSPELEAHDPIVITGNSGFTPANGVRSGSGTEGDPYIIERWEIATEDADGISISDTSDHVVIRLCNIYWPEKRDPYVDGIQLSNAVNVKITDCRFRWNYYQIRILAGSQTKVDQCLFLDSDTMEISSRQSSVELTNSWFHSEKVALHMSGENDEYGLAEDNIIIFQGSNNGGMFFYTIDSRVERNIFMNGSVTAGTTNEDIDFQIHDNIFSGGSAGIWFNDGRPEIKRNLITDHSGWGVYGDESTMTLRNNNLFGNRNWGVQNRDDTAQIDAKYNWWGAANGPSGEGSGDGDAVSEYVDFDPWLEEPYVSGENHAPTLEIMEPDGSGDVADDRYTILWDADDEDGDTITLALYYDTDTSSGNGRTLIEEDVEDTGSYDWDTSGVPEGDYYILGIADDNNGSRTSTYSDGQVHIEHEEPNNDPRIEIYEPDEEGEEADESYTIEWYANDEDGDTVTIDLYYDTDTDPDNSKTLIDDDLENTGEYDWDCSEVDEGEYYIYGVAHDGEGGTGDDHSEGTVLIDHEGPNNPPEIEVEQPDGDDEADEEFTIVWKAEDEDGDTLSISLYYDDDTNPDNGRTLIDGGLENTGSYDWDCSEVEEGEYYIYGLADDGEGGETEDYSAGVLTIDHQDPVENHNPVIEVLHPDEDHGEADEEFTISWSASDQDEDTLEIALYYDDDQSPGNGKTLIADSLGNTGSYDWDCSEVEEGNYYIYAVVEDGEGGSNSDYSSGALQIDHEDLPPVNQAPEVDISDHEAEVVADGLDIEIWWNATDPDEDSLEVSLYYSAEPSFDSSAELIEDELPATGSYQGLVELDEDGDYYLFVEVDDGKGESATDRSGKINVVLPVPAPDFAILTLEIAPSEPEAGDSITISVTVKNLGDGYGSGGVKLLVDNDQKKLSGLSLAPDQEETVTVSWMAEEGEHTVTAELTAPSDDSDPNNHEETQDITVSGGGSQTRDPGSKDDESDFPVLAVGLTLVLVAAIIGGAFFYKTRMAGEEEDDDWDEEETQCPWCGGETEYSEEYDDHYCWECEEYLGEMDDE